MKSITSIGHHNEMTDLVFTAAQQPDAASLKTDLQALVTVLRSDYSKAQSTIETLQALLEAMKTDYDKLAASLSTLMEQLAITNEAVTRETKLANQYRDKCDKLVAENQFLKESYEDDIGAYSATIHVPNTSSAIAEFKARGVDEFAADIGQAYNQLRQGSAQQKALKSFIFRAVDFAANLRAGVKS